MSGVVGRLALPLLAVLAAFAAGALAIAAIGHDPLAAYRALFDGALGGRNHANLLATFERAAPIVALGVAAAVALRGGFLNLGGEGQLVIGALAATLAGLAVPASWAAAPGLAILGIVFALLAGAVAGGLWAGLAEQLHARCAVPTLIGTLLLNYPARHLGAYLASHPLRDAASGLAQTRRLADGLLLPSLGRLDATVPAALAMTLLTAWVLARTRAGYRLRVAGANPEMAAAGGIDLVRLGRRAMFSSGAIAGAIGALMVLAVHHRFIDGALTTPLYAWIGLMAALLAGARPLGVLAAGLLLAAIAGGGFGMERHAGVPRELSQVIQALIILFVAVTGRFRIETR